MILTLIVVFIVFSVLLVLMIFKMKRFDDKEKIVNVINFSNRGVFKRIDENRELLELLYKDFPDVLERCPWVEGWIFSQDSFLSDLASVSHAQNHVQDREFHSQDYPRDFPGKRYRVEEKTISENFKSKVSFSNNRELK